MSETRLVESLSRGRVATSTESLLRGGAAQQSVFDNPEFTDEFLRIAGISPELSKHVEFEPLQKIFTLSHESHSLLQRIEDDRPLSLFEKLRLRSDVEQTFVKLDRLSSELQRNFSQTNIRRQFDTIFHTDEVYTSQHFVKEMYRQHRAIDERENQLKKEFDELASLSRDTKLYRQERQRIEELKRLVDPIELIRYRRETLAQFSPVQEDVLSKAKTLGKIRQSFVPYSEESYRFLDFYLAAQRTEDIALKSSLQMFGHKPNNTLYDAFKERTSVFQCECRPFLRMIRGMVWFFSCVSVMAVVSLQSKKPKKKSNE
jgi:uncharacterized protein YjiS (DUF1127 family)